MRDSSSVSFSFSYLISICFGNQYRKQYHEVKMIWVMTGNKKIRLLPSRTNPQISVRRRSIGRYSEKSIDLTDVLYISQPY